MSCSSASTACSSPAARRTSSPATTRARRASPAPCTIPARDATTLPLIRKAVGAGVPGARDLPRLPGDERRVRRHAPSAVQRFPGISITAKTRSQPLDVQYGPAHEVVLEPGGLLRRLAGTDRMQVNSLHSQGIERLGPGLAVEARAPDGLIEAFRVRGRERVCARGAVASRVEGDEQPVFKRAVCGIRRRRAASARESQVKGQCMVKRDPAVFPRPRHLRGRGHHSRHGGHRARQDHAGGEIRRGRGHAPAGERLPADGDRRLSARDRRGHEPGGDRHRAQGRPEDGAPRAVGGGADRAGDPRLLLLATAGA